MKRRPSMKHDADPEAFADAMLACQGYGPACMVAGECLYEDHCFTSSAAGFKGARQAIADLIDVEFNTARRVWLKLALDALDHHQFMTRGAIDALKVVAINRAVREQYGSIEQKF